MNCIYYNQSRVTNVCKIKTCVKTCSCKCEVGDIAKENENMNEEFLNSIVDIIAIENIMATEKVKNKKKPKEIIYKSQSFQSRQILGSGKMNRVTNPETQITVANTVA